MLEVLSGLISGIVSGIGLGGGTILILILSVFMRSKSAYSTSNKYSILYSNFNNSNNCIYKRKINRF